MKARRDDGAVAVEFAILLPILVVILFATIAFGIALARLISYTGAAREGARYAAVHCAPDLEECTLEAIQDRVIETAAGNPVDLSGFAVNPSYLCDEEQSTVEVTWPQPIPIDIPLLGDLSVTVDISGTFRCE